jgi:hypothetical protein
MRANGYCLEDLLVGICCSVAGTVVLDGQAVVQVPVRGGTA